jgi:hypothetical protein
MVPLDTMASIYPLYSKTHKHVITQAEKNRTKKVSAFGLAIDCTSEGIAK